MKLAKSVKHEKPVEPLSWPHRPFGNGAVRIVLIAVVLICLGSLIGWAVASYSQVVIAPSKQRATVGSIVMISGRDDHGLLQDPTVPLFRAPEDTTVVTHVGNGSYAHVTDQRGEWIRVKMVGSPETTGWVNDYYLRSRVLRTDGGGQVDLVGTREMGGQVWIGVRPVGDSEASIVWLNPSVLQEIGAHDDK